MYKVFDYTSDNQALKFLQPVSKLIQDFSTKTKEEQDVVADRIVARVKEINFKHGLPITYEKDGFVVQEY